MKLPGMQLLIASILAAAILSGCAGMKLTPITDTAGKTWNVSPVELTAQQEVTKAQKACFKVVEDLVADLRTEELARRELDDKVTMSTSEGEVALQFRKAIEAITGEKGQIDKIATVGIRHCADIPGFFAHQMQKSNNRTLVFTSVFGGLAKALTGVAPWIAGAEIAKALAKARGDTTVGGNYTGGDHTGGHRGGRDVTDSGDRNETNDSYNSPGRDYYGGDNNSTGDDNRHDGDNNCADGECDEEDYSNVPDTCPNPSEAYWNGSHWQVSETDTCSCDSRAEGHC